MRPLKTTIYLLFFLFTACTTMRPIPLSPEEVKKNFTTGDIIRVLTKDETRITFEVVEVTHEAIIGVHENIPFQDIVKIEKEELSTAKTTLPGDITIFSVYGTLVVASVALLLLTVL